MSIAFAPIQQEVRVLKITGDEKTRKHLASLGIVVDARLMVLSSQKGNTILKIKDSRLAIHAALAMRIFVEV